MATTAKEEKQKAFKKPKTVAEAADRYYLLMQERLTLQRQADAVEAEEKFVKDWIIETLPMSSATGVAGLVCRVQVVPKVRPEVKNWDDFYDFIVKNRKKGAFALLNRAVNAKAVKEYWDQKKQVPGVEGAQYKTLSYSKIGELPE